MSYCINPKCQSPRNEQGVFSCVNCGASLLLGDRYRALKLIGQGGFGRTFLAVDESLVSKPRCVIKQFLPPNLSTSAASKMFREEAERLKSLGSHPQIPTFLDYLEIDDQRYIIQEFIEGSNLAQELEAEGAFNEAQVRQLLKDILPVLEFVHEHQVIHRDIKPENIIRRSRDRQMFLVDFGAAKYATGTALIKTGTTIGTAGYTAPEQLMGKAVFQSDLYSLGVTCIHLLTQVPPFDLVDSAEGSWVYRDYLNSPINEQLGRILDKLLERGTRKRYQSVTEVMSDLVAKPSVQSIFIPSVDAVQKEHTSLRSKSIAKVIILAAKVIVLSSGVVGVGFGAVYLFNWVNQPLVVRAPQPQPRLIPAPQASPTQKSPQRQNEESVESKLLEELIPFINLANKIIGLTFVICGMIKVNRGMISGEGITPGLSMALTGLMLTLMLNTITNMLVSTSANSQSTTSILNNPQKVDSPQDSSELLPLFPSLFNP